MRDAQTNTNPDVAGAMAFATSAATNFKPKAWWGPTTDAIGLEIGLGLAEHRMPDGSVCTYFTMLPGGEDLLFSAALKHFDAYVLAKTVVSAALSAVQPVLPPLNHFAASVLLGTFPVPATKRGPKVRDNWERDVFIFDTARHLVSKFGLNLTENEARKFPHPPSAVSVIVEACHRAGLKGFSKDVVKDASSAARIFGELEKAVSTIGKQYLTEAMALRFTRKVPLTISLDRDVWKIGQLLRP